MNVKDREYGKLSNIREFRRNDAKNCQTLKIQNL